MGSVVSTCGGSRRRRRRHRHRRLLVDPLPPVRQCRAPPPTPARMPLMPVSFGHHPAVDRLDDSYHVLALAASTLSSLDFTPFHATTSPPKFNLISDVMSVPEDSASSPPPSAFHRPPADTTAPARPLWSYFAEELLSENMDPAVAALYERASAIPVSRTRLETAKPAAVTTSAKVWPLLSSAACEVDLPDGVDKIVVYFTTLRVIRSTYEDCCAVLDIFGGFRVTVDKRDISMDSSLRKQLQSALGQERWGSLPQVFVRGKRVGGADEIKRLLRTGELAKLLQGFPVKDGEFTCQRCGGVRFIPCGNCNGSRKVYCEEDEQFRPCPDCNENGLIRCPDCWS